ncbi:Uncharacterised protein [Pseudescherichia vulneris]|nr:Uncharacterised protein [Pseudescherichia vulneris]
MHQRPGDHQAAFHPAGEHPRLFVAFFPQIELLKVLFATDQRFLALYAIVARLVDNNLLYRLKRVEVELLRHQAKLTFSVYHVLLQVVAKDAYPPRGFIYQRTDDADSGRFTRTVGSQKRVEVTRFYF